MEPVRIWTQAEADKALPMVRALLDQARQAEVEMREAQSQLQDLDLRYEKEARREGHPEHAQWMLWRGRFDAHLARLRTALDTFLQEGISLKDIHTGLVDFHAKRGEELVWLCWVEGEESVTHWHPLEGGFSGRQEIPKPIVGA